MTSYFESNRRVMQRSASFVVFMALAVVLAHPSIGQQATSDDAPKTPAVRKKARGRLPAHFAAVVSPKQRETIYQVQADYAGQLEKLQAQIDALLADRDRDVDAVLTAEQLAEVTKKRDEAKKKRAARSSSKSDPEKTTDG